VPTLQPGFRWRATDPKDAAEFVLMVAGQEKPVHQAKAPGGTYRLSAKLKPDTQYEWMVISGGREIGTGKFRTLPSEAIQAVEKRKPADKAEFSDRLLFALMLHELGAAQDAQEAWSRLSLERGDLPELAGLAR
jgi:hypothetical protein